MYTSVFPYGKVLVSNGGSEIRISTPLELVARPMIQGVTSCTSTHFMTNIGYVSIPYIMSVITVNKLCKSINLATHVGDLAGYIGRLDRIIGSQSLALMIDKARNPYIVAGRRYGSQIQSFHDYIATLGELADSMGAGLIIKNTSLGYFGGTQGKPMTYGKTFSTLPSSRRLTRGKTNRLLRVPPRECGTYYDDFNPGANGTYNIKMAQYYTCVFHPTSPLPKVKVEAVPVQEKIGELV
jgi:hypothetical protein